MNRRVWIVCLVLLSNTLLCEELLFPVFKFEIPQEVVDEYIRPSTQDTWTLNTVSASGVEWVYSKAHTDAIRTINRMQHFLAENASKISPLAEQIATTFTHLYPATVLPSGHVISASTIPQEWKKRGHAICFVARDLYYTNPRQYATRWDVASKSVIMKSAICTTAWFRAIVLHELGHGLRHLEGASSALTNDPELYAQEEIEMHDLETQVLDFHTRGDFSRTVDVVIEELSTSVGMQVITIDHLHQLDRSTDIYMRYGPEVRVLTAAHYSYAIATRLIELYGGGNKEKGQWYIWMRERNHAPIGK